MSWTIFKVVRPVLLEEDIEGLIAIGAPQDEYDGEASMIESELAKLSNWGSTGLSLKDVEEVVELVWKDRFGPFDVEGVEFRRPAWKAVAIRIYESLPS